MTKADQNSDPYNSAIIETAEEVEVPEVTLEPFVSLEPPPDSVEPPLSSLAPPLGSLAPPPLELLAAAARSDLPPPTRTAPLAIAPALEPPAKSTWLARARRHPALGMVVAPVTLAALLVVPFAVHTKVSTRSTRRPSPVASVALPSAAAPAATSVTPAATLADAPNDAQKQADLDALEARDASTLSVDELLRLHERHAERRRSEAQDFYRQLGTEPAKLHDAAIRSRLLKLALDPDTSAGALASMSRAPAPLGPDLLFEVWSSRQAPSSVAELARSLLFSREVRAGASPSLAVALELRSAETCEDVLASLPKVQAEGDVRSIPALAKLVPRRGCGPTKQNDCYACIRPHTPQLLATIKAAQRRKPPRP